jgi:hypothetical protein
LSPRALIPFADNRAGSGASRFVIFGGAYDSDLSNFTGRSNGDSTSASFGVLDIQGGPSLEVSTLELQGHRASGRRKEGAIDGIVLWGDPEVEGGLSGAQFTRGLMGTSYELFELPKEQGLLVWEGGAQVSSSFVRQASASMEMGARPFFSRPIRPIGPSTQNRIWTLISTRTARD